jgi:PAS domain S-box-containing protein
MDGLQTSSSLIDSYQQFIAFDGAGRRVMIVDDDPDAWKPVGRFLHSAGLDVEISPTVPEFLSSDRPETPTCLVLVGLTGADTPDFQEKLAAASIGVPIIFVNGRDDIRTPVGAMKNGAIDFLGKPFRDQDLVELIECALAQDRAWCARQRETVTLSARFETLELQGQIGRFDSGLAGEPKGLVTAAILDAEIARENTPNYSDLQLQAALLQHLPVSAWTLKPDGTPDFVNQVWLEYSGQTLDFVRSHPGAWMTAVHPEDRETASKAFWSGVRSGQGFAVETRSLRAQDGTYRWHINQAVGLRDAKGKVIKFVGTTTDIDDQKRAEEALRQAQGDLARINRVTTMGELAASLAHELSQPITGATVNANVCLRKLEADKPDFDELRTSVARILRDAQRAAEIIGRIRSQFVSGTLRREVIDIDEINREMVALLRDQAVRHNITVRTDLAADLPRIVGDRVQLQQVAMNLIVNSIEATKDVNGIREIAIKSQRAENDQVLVSVSDTGIGFPPDLAEQIFDPFFTTKPDGTGMGLRISRSIIESHGGRLWAVGSSGCGATFHFTLPASIPGQR